VLRAKFFDEPGKYPLHQSPLMKVDVKGVCNQAFLTVQFWKRNHPPVSENNV
jgi:hypothetical protein